MTKKSNSQSAFFNLRVLIGLFIAMAGISLALLATANPPRFVWTTSSHPQIAQMPQKYKIMNIQGLPPGFDCSTIYQKGIYKMEGFRAGLIMINCGEAEGGSSSPHPAFSRLVRRLTAPLAYGATDVDLI